MHIDAPRNLFILLLLGVIDQSKAKLNGLSSYWGSLGRSNGSMVVFWGNFISGVTWRLAFNAKSRWINLDYYIIGGLSPWKFFPPIDNPQIPAFTSPFCGGGGGEEAWFDHHHEAGPRDVKLEMPLDVACGWGRRTWRNLLAKQEPQQTLPALAYSWTRIALNPRLLEVYKSAWKERSQWRHVHGIWHVLDPWTAACKVCNTSKQYNITPYYTWPGSTSTASQGSCIRCECIGRQDLCADWSIWKGRHFDSPETKTSAHDPSDL